MMAVTHLVTGAAIARVTRDPRLAYPIAFLSYLVLDSIPHQNVESLVSREALPAVLALDLALGLLAVGLLIRGQPRQVVVWGAVGFAALPALLCHLPAPPGWPASLWFDTFDRYCAQAAGEVGVVEGFSVQGMALGLGLLVLGLLRTPAPGRGEARSASLHRGAAAGGHRTVGEREAKQRTAQRRTAGSHAARYRAARERAAQERAVRQRPGAGKGSGPGGGD